MTINTCLSHWEEGDRLFSKKKKCLRAKNGLFVNNTLGIDELYTILIFDGFMKKGRLQSTQNWNLVKVFLLEKGEMAKVMLGI